MWDLIIERLRMKDLDCDSPSAVSLCGCVLINTSLSHLSPKVRPNQLEDNYLLTITHEHSCYNGLCYELRGKRASFVPHPAKKSFTLTSLLQGSSEGPHILNYRRASFVLNLGLIRKFSLSLTPNFCIQFHIILHFVD